MTETVAAPRPEMLPRVDVLAEAYAPLVERWGSVFDVIERAEPEELPVELLDAVAEMEAECERVRAEALARLQDVNHVVPRLESKPSAFGLSPCRTCGELDRYPSGNCRPCNARNKRRRLEKARARMRKAMAALSKPSGKPGSPRKTHCGTCGSPVVRRPCGRWKCFPCASRWERERYLRRKAERAQQNEAAPA